ncbi:MAG: fasciclin domain-containing protein [Bacteroidaceae bacterium]|nr:fasciclin domain-containing protein [Bacteroidaceae bacterium]
MNFWAVALFFLSVVQMGIVSCSDDPGVENYYTAVREYASDYLQNREQFSEYVQILQKATGERGDLRLIDMLGTYGSYTVFAPTNEAVDKYLRSKGVSSVDELSKEDCDTIALNSIIEKAFFTTDYSNGQYPKSNMLEHIVSVKSDTVWSESKQDSVLAMYINQSALIAHADDSVGNGVVHTMNSIVDSNNDLIGTVLLKDSACLLYCAALQVTGMIDSLQYYVDDTYGWATSQDRIDSCTWTNDKLCIHTAVEYDNVAYPEKRYFNFTVFMCPDSILYEKYGIETLDDLRAKARELYEPVYPEDADVTDETDRRNYLNRFISYHILDRYGTYLSLTSFDNNAMQYCFNRRKYDMCDWYPTLMPHSSMKFSFPSGAQAGLYINRRGVQSRADERGVFVRGARVTNPKDMTVDQTAINGIYHYIDDVAAYDRTTQEVVFNECIRLDCTTLSPDFMTLLTDGETARGHTCRTTHHNGLYGDGGQGPSAASNKNTCIGFKSGYARNISYSPATHLHVRMKVLGFWSYEGDEVTIKGRFDVTVKLPPVPEGTYEVRMMTCTAFDSRGIVQYYLGDDPDHMIPQGIPFDMRPNGRVLYGFKTDDELGDEDAIAAFDKAIHNIGWMKGPKVYEPGDRSSYGAAPTMRNLGDGQTCRRVIGTFHTDGKTDQYLRLQQKMESENNELNFDFIEICPSSVYNNEYFPEPQW